MLSRVMLGLQKINPTLLILKKFFDSELKVIGVTFLFQVGWYSSLGVEGFFEFPPPF